MTTEAGAQTGSRRGGRQSGGRRAGGRSGNTRRGTGKAISQLPWSLPEYRDRPTEPLDEDGVQRIHDGAMRILEEIGIHFHHPDAKATLKKAGCTVDADSDCVWMDRDFVMEQVAKAPSQFDIIPRNRDRRITIGGNKVVFANVSSPPNYSTLDDGRKSGSRKAYQDLLKLTQYFNCLQFVAGYPVEPIDIHPSIRHLDAIYDKLVLTDKACHAYSLGTERIEDAMEMVRIAGGLSHEDFEASPRMFTNINSTSPLKHDWPMLDGAMRMAARNQPVVVAPFTLAGAMAPVTLAGAIALQTAEGLAAIALLQCVRPGAPVVYGSFTSNVDMKTGAPAFGTPEYMRATQMSGQMARFYNLPLRASNANAANFPDAQAAWESAFSLFGSMTGHTNMIYHGAGWLEGGLCASYEKFIIDCEMIQQLSYYLRSVPVSEDDIAVEAIREVGHRGHFFGGQHTQERYETAFYSPFLSDWSNFESWQERGSLTAHERANTIWKNILAEFEPPPIDEAIREELDAFVARRKEEGGAPTDF
jgi:trimethylamine--corrinoid protein Co-methyltransferase